MENELPSTSAMPRDLTFQLLQRITNNFSKDRIIGYGGYGVVYKGVLDNGEEIAVKKLYFKHPELDEDKQFENECTNLMMVQHQNVVRLVGYCYEIAHKAVEYNGRYVLASVEERALCFEYLPGGSLDKHLSDESCGLGWHTRYKIIKGICEGLHYLHNGSKDPIYHLDLKPANILLDKNMVAKIGDFGLSRLFDSTRTYTTREIRGTPGYMPPEYIDRFKITPKFDVFSLGVIIIQIMAGREGYSKCGDMSSQEFFDLVHDNWLKTLQTTMALHTAHEVKTCIEIALRCVEANRVKRPSIAEIVDELNKIDIPKRSLIDQVTNSESKKASNQYVSSGAADAESDFNPRIKYGDEGISLFLEQNEVTSMGTKDEELRILEHKVLKEDLTEHYKTQDSGRRSGGTLNKLLSAFAGVWPTSKAASEVPAKRKKAASEGRDGLLWWHDLVPCQAGGVSVSVMQANHLLEDQSCVESASPLGTVIGVFDGHGGPEAARFACDHLLPKLQEAVSGRHDVTADAIRKAFMAMEEGFIALVSSLWETKPSLATIGTCCLVGIVHQGTLFVANLGDSRAVLGKVGHNGRIIAEQLSSEHNVNYEGVRKELMAQHPDDPQIVVFKHDVWRVRGIIQVSRSLGDAYLKHQQFNREPLPARFRLPEPFSQPLLSASPSIISRSLQPSDHFIIFASDGLWEFLSNQEAVEIVRKHERTGIARRLIKAAMIGAANKMQMRYSDLKRIEKGILRHFHDDITVVVLFTDYDMQMRREEPQSLNVQQLHALEKSLEFGLSFKL
ncbi:hypothetical protein ZWY2020_032044 [Hordeum vulgare]|nr:hypothetical protein ZWY2020_032044 [Hordeum vulgare]